MSRTFNSTQMSAACSRGLTRSHISPIPPIPPLSPLPPIPLLSPLPTSLPNPPTLSTPSSLSSLSSLPSTPMRRPVPPSTPVRRPHPFRGRPVEEAAAVTSSDSPLMGYIPTPIQAPVFSPIRSPFSPCGSFPSTPSTPPTKYFVSPVKQSEGARERRRESRPSPLTSLLASKGIQREVTPKPRALCPECTKVKMLLPARWCGHQVTPSRMKDGWRVVRINPNLGKTKSAKAQKPRKSRRTGVDKAKPVAADLWEVEAEAEQQLPLVDEQPVEPRTPESKASSLAVDEPAVGPSTPRRVATSPIVESTPAPEPSAVWSPSVHTPFRNPDLDDQPLHWSPRMFKPEIDRHNWTWSEWDSPSQTIEEVTYQTDDWPIHDPFARYPPEIRQRLRDVLAMKPILTDSSDSAEEFSSVHLNYENIIGRRYSPEEKDDTKSSDLSSWVLLKEHPWPPALLQMWIDSEKDRERDAARRQQLQLHDDTSTVSSFATTDLLAEINRLPHDPPGPNHSESNHSGSNYSNLANKSFSFELYTGSDNACQQRETEDKGARNNSSGSVHEPEPSPPDAPTPSVSRPKISTPLTSTSDVSIPSTLFPDMPTASASIQEEPALPSHAPEAPSTPLQPIPEMPTILSNSIPKAATPPEAVPDAPALAQSPEEFSSWVDLDTRKWTDLTFRFHAKEEEARRIGLFDNDSDDSDSEDSDFSFNLTGHLKMNYGITKAPQEHFRSLRDAQQSSGEVQPAAPILSVSPSFTARRQLPSVTIMEPHQRTEELPRGSGFGWKSLACVAVTAAAVGAGLAYAWFSG